MIKRNLILLAGLLCCLTGLYAQDHKLEVRKVVFLSVCLKSVDFEVTMQS